MNDRVLITGGMGLIGGRVAQSLAERGYAVKLGSRKMQPVPSWLARAEVIPMDWLSSDSLISACNGVDAIVHLAAMNDLECLSDPVSAVEVNVVNTVRLVEAAKVTNVKRLIYFSTAHIYGAPLVGYVDETTLPSCKHPYATSHRAAEDVVLASGDKLSSVVLRLSNGFGRPSHAAVNSWNLLVNDLCRQAVTNRNLTLRSSGLQRRDFITLYDVCQVVDHMINLPDASIQNGIFNVGSGKSMQVVEMADMIKSRCTALFGYSPDIIRPMPDAFEVDIHFEYCIDKLRSTGFDVKGNFHQEIDSILMLCKTLRQYFK